MKVLAIVTISLCWTSIARAAPPKDRFSALLDPQYIDKVGDLPPPHDYKESAAMSVADLWKFLEVGLILMEQKKSALSEAMEKWTEINNGKRNPQWERAHDLANELDRMTYTDNSLGLPFDDLRSTYGFCALVPEEARLEILEMMKKFGQSRLNSRLLVTEYRVKLLRMRINESYDRTTKEKDLDKLDYVRRNIPTVQKELAAREVRYNGLIEPFQGARDTDVNDKGKAPMGHGGQTSADQVGPQNYPFPCPEQTSTGYNQEDLYTIVAQRPQSINNIYAGDSWGDVWALNQGGVNDGPYLASEAYMNQHEASTLGYQEFHGGASGLGHGAKHSSVYEGSTLMHDSYLYHGGQTSVDQIEPQNLPVLPFPEQTARGYDQEHFNTMVAHLPQFNYDSWRHGESHTSASQVDNPMHPRDHGSEIGQNSVHDNTAHRDDQYTLSKYDKGPSYRHIQK
ncbi:hypothetical protein SeLEV6574_g04348 [Synchytrium endobioticum]|uniref:Uncharacterized protein n=1 Tax=Synchytrium endobioticum TaxID=286115 RepID=A0A507D073_9FUNG|nr:hypothetical protein SeLEV6574_g04348 [Synchytrium endobioticum]